MHTQSKNLTTPAPACPARRAIVVFEDRCQAKSLLWLRRGYRHCFCLIQCPVGWLVCDPLKAATRLDVITAYDELELLAHYGRLGMQAIAGDRLPTDGRPSFVRPLTCVELVKRIVGLRDPAVWTPYQLYRALRSHGFEGPDASGHRRC